MNERAYEVSFDGDRTIIMRRTFAAPVTLLWRCYTEPDLVRKWLLGPDGWEMPVCEIDLRVGGRYLYQWRNVEEPSNMFGFTGEFTAISHEQLIEHSEQMVGMEDLPPSTNHIDFVTDGEDSIIVIRSTYATKEICEQVMQTGMTDGVGQSFDRLEGMLEEGLNG